jgi:lactate dehydrogenase-like 2-hydroxyacid dehydrogenase
MKAVAYNIEPYEKEFLAKANQKKHDITLISNPLSRETVIFAEGKDAIIVLTDDAITAHLIEKLSILGIKYIVTNSDDAGHIDKAAAASYGIKIANISANPLPNNSNEALQQIADQTIKSLDLWQQNKCLGNTCVCAKNCQASPVNKD